MQSTFVSSTRCLRSRNAPNTANLFQKSVGSSRERSDFEESENELNVAFIADESRYQFSDTRSLFGQRSCSQSQISRIRSNGSLNFRIEDDMMSISEFALNPAQNSEKQQLNRIKRSFPEMQAEEIDEQLVRSTRTTKKKLTEKMSVMTIQSGQSAEQTKREGYYLRKRRIADNQDSEASQIQGMLEMIGGTPVRSIRKVRKMKSQK